MSRSGGTPATRVLLAVASGEVGGGTTHVLQLLEGLDRRRWLPSLVCDPAGPLASTARDLGVEVFTLPFMKRRLRPRLILRLRRLVARRDFSLVHAHGTRAGLAVRLALAGRREPFIYTEHGLASDVRRGRLLRALARRSEAIVARGAHTVISLSDHSRMRLLSFASVREEKIEVIPNAVTLPRASDARERWRRELGIAPETAVVGTVARMIDVKAPLDLIRTACIVSAVRPEARWVIVGDGPLRPAAERAAAAARAPVTFLGAREDAGDITAAFDIFCLASRSEGVPMAALEAMARSVPIVATAVGGLPSIVVHGENGLLVEPGDPEKLARAIDALLDDPALRETMGERGRERILSRHTVDRLLGRVSDTYRRAVGHAGTSSRGDEPSAVARAGGRGA